MRTINWQTRSIDWMELSRTRMKFIFLAFIFGINPSYAAKMWYMELPSPQGVTKIYILGVTHMGLPAEYDDIFRNRVLPAFDGSDIFHYEDGGGKSWQKACAKPFDDPEKNRFVDSTREHVRILILNQQHYLQGTGLVPKESEVSMEAYSRVIANGFSELGLISAIRLYGGSKPPNPAQAQALAQLHPVVDALRARRPSIPFRSVDGPDDVVDAYCGMGEHRFDFFKEQVSSLISKPSSLGPDVGNTVAELDQAWITSIRENQVAPPFGDDTAITVGLTCGRNVKWLNALLADRDGKSHFYALGFAHLFTNPGCKGLIADLIDNGAHVEPIQ